MRFPTYLPIEPALPAWVLTEISDRGADRAVVSFSGGNDEGDINTMRLYAGDECVADLDWDWVWDIEDDSEPVKDRLVKFLHDAVFDRYSFTGEPDIAGTLTISTVDRKKSWHVEEERW